MESYSSNSGARCPRIERAPLCTFITSRMRKGWLQAGTLSLEVGGQRIDAAPGQAVRLPRGVAHRWWNEGDQPLAFKGRTRPVVDLDDTRRPYLRS